MISPGLPSILMDVGCAPRGSTLIEEGLGEWTCDSRLFLGLHPCMIAHVLTNDQDVFKPCESMQAVEVNGSISPIDPTDTPKGVPNDSSHDPRAARNRQRQHAGEAAGRVRAWPLAALMQLGPLARAFRRA